MSEVSRQQRRREIRERIKKGHQLLGQGLPLQPRASEIVAVAQVVRAKLEETGNARRAGEAAEIAQSLAERSLAARPATKQQIACTRSFGRAVTELSHLQEAISEFTTRAAEKLRRHHATGGLPARCCRAKRRGRRHVG